jgi:hypothetical protein
VNNSKSGEQFGWNDNEGDDNEEWFSMPKKVATATSTVSLIIHSKIDNTILNIKKIIKEYKIICSKCTRNSW